jgi:hypothetical protein
MRDKTAARIVGMECKIHFTHRKQSRLKSPLTSRREIRTTETKEETNKGLRLIKSHMTI